MDIRSLKIEALRREGIVVSDMSADEWLAEAIEIDALCRACGPLDPASEALMRRRDLLLKAAELAQ